MHRGEMQQYADFKVWINSKDMSRSLYYVVAWSNENRREWPHRDQDELQEASTHKSAKTHAMSRDLGT